MQPTTAPNTNDLDADLYSAGTNTADAENISATGNLNIGQIIDYDAANERRFAGEHQSGDLHSGISTLASNNAPAFNFLAAGHNSDAESTPAQEVDNVVNTPAFSSSYLTDNTSSAAAIPGAFIIRDEARLTTSADTGSVVSSNPNSMTNSSSYNNVTNNLTSFINTT